MHTLLELAGFKLILVLARGHTLASAAERLKVDASAVFHGIKWIEKEVGELLFERSRQGYFATEVGCELVAHAERIESELQGTREAALKRTDAPSGVLHVTTIDTVVHALLPGRIAQA